jgi:uncharacterized protein (TIGR03435 family)
MDLFKSTHFVSPAMRWLFRRQPAFVTVLAAVTFCVPKSVPAQTPSSFEVASIKPVARGATGTFIRMPSPGHISMTNFTLREIIQWGYGSPNLAISGAPKWIDSENDSFDIDAKGDVNATTAQLREMTKTLLADRFHLKAHFEQKEVPIYALVLAREDHMLGPKISDMTGQPCQDGRTAPPDEPGMPRCGGFITSHGLTLEGATMKHLADALSRSVTDLGRPVVDRTGLPGEYRITLEFSFRRTHVSESDTPDQPSLFTALQEELGLKLKSARSSVDILVIDRVQRPTPN